MANDIWKRRLKRKGRPNETDVAWAAFQKYREMRPDQRSLRNLAEQINGRLSTIEEWSVKHEWVSRAAAYDRWKDEKTELDKLAARKREIEDAAAARSTAWAVAKLALSQYHERLASGEVKVAPKDIKALVSAAVELSGVETPEAVEKRLTNATLKDLFVEAQKVWSGMLGADE